MIKRPENSLLGRPNLARCSYSAAYNGPGRCTKGPAFQVEGPTASCWLPSRGSSAPPAGTTEADLTLDLRGDKGHPFDMQKTDAPASLHTTRTLLHTLWGSRGFFLPSSAHLPAKLQGDRRGSTPGQQLRAELGGRPPQGGCLGSHKGPWSSGRAQWKTTTGDVLAIRARWTTTGDILTLKARWTTTGACLGSPELDGRPKALTSSPCCAFDEAPLRVRCPCRAHSGS